MLTVTTPIPVYPGDDWSFAFAVATATGAPFDLTGCTVVGELVADRLPAPLDLSADTLRASIVDPGGGGFALGVEAAVTAGLIAPSLAGLQIGLVGADGRRHTFGAWPLQVLPPIGFAVATPPVGARLADALTGASITFVGLSTAVPGLLPSLDLSLPANSQYLALI